MFVRLLLWPLTTVLVIAHVLATSTVVLAQDNCADRNLRYHGIVWQVASDFSERIKDARDEYDAALAEAMDIERQRIAQADAVYQAEIERANEPTYQSLRAEIVRIAEAERKRAREAGSYLRTYKTELARSAYASAGDELAAEQRKAIDEKLRKAGLGPDAFANCARIWVASELVSAPNASANYATLCAPTIAGTWKLVQRAAGTIGHGKIEIPTDIPRYLTARGEASAVGSFEAVVPATNSNAWSGTVLITRPWNAESKQPGIMELHQQFLRRCKCTLAGCTPCKFALGERLVRWEIIALPGYCDPKTFQEDGRLPTRPQ